MGAVSFIYNLEPTALTLDDEEKAKFGLTVVAQGGPESAKANAPAAGTQYPFAQRSTLPTNGKDLTPDAQLKKISGQVSSFFGSIFKEVKTISATAAEDLAELTSGSGLATTSATSSRSTGSPQAQNQSVANANAKERARIRQESLAHQDEEFELQMALALSLSEKNESPFDVSPATRLAIKMAMKNGSSPETPALPVDEEDGETPLSTTIAP
jgi:hypothetical protein